MNITAGRQALATLVAGVSGITFSPVTQPEFVAVNQLPAAIVKFRRLVHDVIGTGGVYEQGTEYRVTVVVSRNDEETAEAAIEEAFDGILAALRADPTLGGVCDDLRARSSVEPMPVPESQSAVPAFAGSIDVTLISEER